MPPDPQEPPKDAPNAAPRRAVTLLLAAAADGDPAASEQLLSTVYEELRAIAHRQMSDERRGHTLQATALVHEVYLKLLGRDGPPEFENRGHFFRAAADAMRKILIDHARARKSQKRGGGKAALQIGDIGALIESPNPDGFLALDDAISRLEVVDPQAASVVRLRFFAGLSEQAAAAALGLSERTARRDWAFARAWLRDALERDERQDSPQ